MKRRILGTILGISMFLMAGCQPTPDGPIVGNKNDGKLEEQLKATPAPTASYEVPENVKEKFENAKGDISVSIDAKVVLPEINTYPVSVVKAKEIEREFVDKLRDYFAPGKELYRIENVATRAALEQRIKACEEDIVDCTKRGDMEGVERAEIQKAKWEEELKTAPEERPRHAATTEFYYNDNSDSYVILADADLDNGEVCRIHASNRKTETSVDVGGVTHDFNLYELDIKQKTPVRNEIENLGKSEAEALEEAKTFLRKMGLAEYQYSGRIYAYIEKEDENGIEQPNQEIYGFCFQRDMGMMETASYEVPIVIDTDVPEGYTPPQQLEYIPLLKDEIMCVLVGKDGVARFYWRNPIEVVEVLNENVELMPFEEIMEKARKYVFFQLPSIERIEQGISITEIRLSYLRIQRKDSPYEYLLVPVWDFVGTQSIVHSKHISRYTNVSFATINAIDGTLIKRAMQ